MQAGLPRFSHLEPIGGMPSDASPGHLYRYLVRGQDQVARFRWNEAVTSDDYGILSITVEQVDPTDVDLEPALRAPGRILVFPNSPDPFNPSTEIRYVLPASTEVQVGIFDIRGRMVRQLVSGNQSGGIHVVHWDGRLDSGTRAPSGPYFARVATPQATGTERLTLIQ